MTTQEFINDRRKARFAVHVGRLFLTNGGRMTENPNMSVSFTESEALALAAKLDGKAVSHFVLYAAGVLVGCS